MHLNAAAAFTVRRHLSAVIFIKLRHSQPLAPHRSLSLSHVGQEFRRKTVVAHLNSTLSAANQIIGKVNWILT